MDKREKFRLVVIVGPIVFLIALSFTLRTEELEKGEFIETIVLLRGEEHQVARTGYSLILLEAALSESLWHSVAGGTIEVYDDSQYIARKKFVRELQIENLIIVLSKVGDNFAKASLYLK